MELQAAGANKQTGRLLGDLSGPVNVRSEAGSRQAGPALLLLGEGAWTVGTTGTGGLCSDLLRDAGARCADQTVARCHGSYSLESSESLGRHTFSI